MMSTSVNQPIMGLALNDHKAGMQSLDKERINQIIIDASKGSKFYEKELRKEEEIKERIKRQQQTLDQVSPQQIASTKAMIEKMIESLESERHLHRTIVHIDMDAFYAAVEMKDNESLRHKPMAVGGNSMLSTSNYIARRYGVRAAMPGFIAKKLCPDLVIVPPDFEKYTSISKEIRSVLAEYDVNYCPMSLDEAYLDLTNHLTFRKEYLPKQRTFSVEDEHQCKCITDECLDANRNKMDNGCRKLNLSDQVSNYVCKQCEKIVCENNAIVFGTSAAEAVKEMRFKIQQKTRLTASAGIAPNMMLAKVCSDKNKPNGQFEISPSREAVTEFIKELPLRKISGIGKVTEKMLQAIGIVTCTDLLNNLPYVFHLYSKISFNYFLRVCLGLGSTTVERDEGRKSISTERTFVELYKPDDLFAKCSELVEALVEDLKEEKIMGKTVTIKLKTVGFEIRTRALTMLKYANDYESIHAAARRLLLTEIQRVSPAYLRIRLMGVRLSNLLNVEESIGQPKQQSIKSLFSVECTPKQPVDIDDSKTDFKTGHNIGPDSDHNNEDEKDRKIMACDYRDQIEQPDVKEAKNACEMVSENCDETRNTEIEKEEIICEEVDVITENCDNIPEYVSNTSDNLESELRFENECENHVMIYTCPVCNNCVPCRAMREFNDHLDSCLSSQQIAEQKSDEISSRNNSKISKTKDKSVIKKQRRNSSKSLTKKETSLNCSDIKTWITDSQDVSVVDDNQDSNSVRKLTKFVCPICNLPQPKLKDLSAFNDHVDRCLSRGTIHTILQEQKGLDSTLKRKSVTLPNSQPTQTKRKKLNSLSSSQTTTIDSFFR